MNRYLENFLQHSGQIDSFLATAAVWIGFAAVGCLFLGREKHGKIIEAAPFYGWAVINFALTAFGVFKVIPFPALGILAGLAALAAGAVAYRRKQPILPAGTMRMVLLAAPLLLLVSAMVGSQWDEFSDWLMTPRQLLITGGFPTADNVHLSGRLAAYPFGWHYVTYLTSLLAGRLVENAGALFNVLTLLTFGLLSVRLIRSGLGRADEGGAPPSWGLVATCGLMATLLNTTFAQKVALTSYADVATAAAAGFGGIIGWYMLGAFAGKRREDALHHALQLGLLMMLLVNLKQSTVALAGIVIAAVLLAGLRDEKIAFGDLIAALPRIIVPPLVLFLIWRYYVSMELTTGEMTVRPVSQWLIAEIPQIIWNMLVVLSKKGAYLALMAVATGFGIRAMIRSRTPFDRLAIIVGATFLAHNAFLLFAYVTTFGQADALRVASLWRYNMQLGLLGVAFTAYGLAVAWAAYGRDRFNIGKAAPVAVLLMIAAPFVFADKLRFDNDGPLPHYRAVAAEMNDLLTDGDSLTVADPLGSGESGEIVRFEMGGTGIFQGYHAFHQKMTLELWRRVFSGGEYTHVLVHSTSPELEEAAGMKLEKGTSYLLKIDDAGGWRVVGDWSYPG